MKTADFLATHPVFSLDQAVEALRPPRGAKGAVDRLKHHLETGRLRLVTREVYAVVPPGLPAQRFRPDAFLVAAAARPDAVFCHHSALELLGSAHSMWNRCTVYTMHRRRALHGGGGIVEFLSDPEALCNETDRHFGTRRVEWHGQILEVTGPERTLVEGLRRPGQAGGLEELVNSASGFSSLDLELLEKLLGRYGERKLFAAAGWFLDAFKTTFNVPEEVLDRLERGRPSGPRYLLRSSRGGTLVPRWNLILPRELTRMSEPDEP